MKEIRFRAYISDTKEMIYSYQKQDKYRFSFYFTEGLILEKYDTSPRGAGYIDSDIMQYTGLTDKNGVKIYEGDIVNMIQDNKAYTKIIEYSCGYSPTRHAGYNISPIYRDAIEVIGNIHQHPHLIP